MDFIDSENTSLGFNILQKLISKIKKSAYSTKQTITRWLGPRCQKTRIPKQPVLRILVLGVLLSNKENSAHEVISELNRKTHHKVTQHWIALGDKPSSVITERFITFRILEKIPKFELLNRLIKNINLNDFDVVMVFDDDIILPKNFLDRFLEVQYFCDFSLCQPSRNHNSWIDHPMVEQVKGSLARQTRFVEIGPVFSIRSDAFKLLLPFSEASPMGWGLDFVWPLLIEKNNKKMGIVDAVPIDHSLRKPVQHYDWRSVEDQQEKYLKHTPHLKPESAFQVTKIFNL